MRPRRYHSFIYHFDPGYEHVTAWRWRGHYFHERRHLRTDRCKGCRNANWPNWAVEQ